MGEVSAGETLVDQLWTDFGLRTPIPWMGKWLALLARGDDEGLESWVDSIPFESSAGLFRAFLAVRQNPSSEGLDELSRTLLDAYAEGWPAWLAFHLLVRSGRASDALTVAEKEIRRGGFGNVAVLFDIATPEVRQLPRFTQLVESLGFVDYWKRAGVPTFCEAQPETPVCGMLSAP